jgi:hypothetical protein
VQAYAKKLQSKNKMIQAAVIQEMFFRIVSSYSEASRTAAPPQVPPSEEQPRPPSRDVPLSAPPKPSAAPTNIERRNFIGTFSTLVPKNRGESDEDYENRIRRNLEDASFIQNKKVLKMGSVSSIPEEISKLTNLTTLIMTFSSIRELPESMKKLTNLERITFSHTPNIEQLPEWVFDLPKLREIRVLDNPELANSIPEKFRPKEAAPPPARPAAAAIAPSSQQTPASGAAAPPVRPRAISCLDQTWTMQPSTLFSADETASEIPEYRGAVLGLPKLDGHITACKIPDDGHCLFTSIIVGFLARKTVQEVRDLFINLQDTSGPYANLVQRMKNQDMGDKEAKQFDRELHESIGEILGSITENETTTPIIDAILHDKDTRNRWAHCFRLLAVAEEFQQQEANLLFFAKDDWGAPQMPPRSGFEIPNNEFIDAMCTDNPLSTTFGGQPEMTALQAILKIPMVTISLNDADGTAIYTRTPDLGDEQMTLKKIRDEEIILFKIPLHYDTGFLPTF